MTTTINFNKKQFTAFKKEAAPFMDFIKSNRKSNYFKIQLVVFEVSFDYLCISIAMDGYETSFTTRTPQISGGPTKFAIDLDDFTNFLKCKDEISIQKDGDKITVINGDVNIDVQDMSLELEEFPWDKSEPKSFAIANANTVFNNLDKFVIKDDLRPAMKGTFFNLTDGVLRTCTTDANKMVHTLQENVDGDNTQLIMPLGIIKSVQKVLKTDFKGEVVCIVYKKMVTVSIGDYFFTSKVIDANYPDYTVAIPSRTNFAVQLNKQSLISAIERISPSIAKSKKLTSFTFYKDKLIIFGWDNAFKKKAFAEITVQGIKTFNEGSEGNGTWTEGEMPYLNIGLNYEHVLDVLNTVVGETVTINLISPSHAVLFSTPEDGIQQPILLMVMWLTDKENEIPNPKAATDEQVEAFINAINTENEGRIVLDKSFFQTVFNTLPIDERLQFLFWNVPPIFNSGTAKDTVTGFFKENRLSANQDIKVYVDKIFGGWTLEQVKEFCEKENVD